MYCLWAIVVCWQLSWAYDVHAQGGGWTPPVNLSDTMTKSWLPAACADSAGNVHVFWAEFVNPDSESSDTLYYRKWDGQNWSRPAAVLVTGGPASQAQNAVWYPACAADDSGVLHVVWTDTHSVYYSQAAIDGEPWRPQAWSKPKAIYPNRGNFGSFPDIAVDPQGSIHVVFSTYDQSYHIRSDDGGGKWSVPVSIFDTPNVASRPRISIEENGTMHVGISEVDFTDSALNVVYARSTDGGETWDDVNPLSLDTEARYPVRMIARREPGGALRAIWPDNIMGVFYERRSMDEGDSWGKPETIVQGSPGFGWPALASDSGGVAHLLVSVGGEIEHRAWEGSVWSSPDNISRTPTSSDMPILVVTNGNRLHAIWMEWVEGQRDVHDEGNMEIFYSTETVSAPFVAGREFSPVPTPSAPAVTETPTREAPTAVPPAATGTPPRVNRLRAGSAGPSAVVLTGLASAVVVLGLVVGWSLRRRRV